MLVALRLAYDGRFAGFARQPQGGTVEDAAMAAVAAEGLMPGTWRTGSRTDRGVAAVCNVVACELDRPHLRGLVPAIQSRLPPGLWITGAAAVEPPFDPRRAAWREYAYHLPGRKEDVDAMQKACAAFVGTRDMTAFARVEDRDPMRTILACGVEAQGDWWVFHVRGHAFLWNQVRRMTDAIVQVGRNRASVDDVEASLASGRPHPSFGISLAEGLLLQQVAYDPEPDWQTAPTRSVTYAQRARVEFLLAEAIRH